MKLAICVMSILAFCAVYAGQGHQHEHGHKDGHDHGAACEHGHEHRAEGNLRSVEIAEGVQKALGLKTVHPEHRRLQGIRVFTGRYELAPEARRAIVSPVAGRLRLAVKPLDKVEKGRVLFTIESPDLVARSREIELLERRLGVYRGLKSANAALENELAVKKAARAALVAGNEEKDGVVTIRATATGVVEALGVSDGAGLETGTEVLRLVRKDSLRLKALVVASEAGRLADGLACEVEGVTGELRLGMGDDTGLVPVYAVFPKGTLRGRTGARARLVCMTDASAPESRVVPASAIVRIGLQPTVFVRDEHDADRFLAMPVTPGVSNGGWTAIDGLPNDDDLEVVSEGAYELKLGLAASGSANSAAGHFHADGTFHSGKEE